MNIIHTEVFETVKGPVTTHQIDSFRDVFTYPELDCSRVCISYADNINFQYEFPVTPDDYLKFAKKDFSGTDDKALINALCHAKRAIDCLVETVLRNLGIDPDNIPATASEFCDHALKENSHEIKPKSLRLFSALGFAPTLLISEVRNLRHTVEHRYQVPERNDVRKAIELAELLISNVKAKELYSRGIWLSDAKSSSLDKDGFARHESCVVFTDCYKKRSPDDVVFSITSFKADSDVRLEYIFRGDEPIFFFLLRAMFVAEHDEEALRKTISSALKSLELNPPRNLIRITKVYS